MRLLSRLLIVLVVCLVAMALLATPAQAVDGGAYITLDPDGGVPGINVTVSGGNFTDNEWVDIYYYLDTTNTTNRIRVKEVHATSAGRFTITFPIPESCTGDHRVLADGDDGSLAEAGFEVKPGLTVNPKKGPVGTNVTVEGHGFAEDEGDIELRYYLDSTSQVKAQNISADDDGWWKKSFVIPPSAKGSHKIDARGDDSSLAAVEDATFEVTPGISIGKSLGSVGENITMTGSGFYANDRYITILFAGKEVETEIRVDADAEGYWEKDFKVPEMPKGTYNVTAEGESTPKEAISARSFEIKPDIVLSPDEGYVGIDLTVAGRGFAANKDVVIKYEGSQVETATTNNKGSFSGVSFLVPESQHGGRQVTAEVAAKIEATAIFTMESVPPPIPTLTSPADGGRVGFIGKVRSTFEWSAVSDDSGVRYRLQIATSVNVTATGFTDPIVSVSDIVGTNYTLNATEALPYGTYYWIVQALDRAENESNWTAARSFHAGLLPLWAFILIIIAIVVLIGALVYFFIRRRGIHYY